MSDEAQDWPFEKWLRLAIIHLKLSPEDFWNMPVRDWFWLCRKSEKTAVSLDDFQELFQQFPDGE
jgi:hypothetical protein